MEFFENVSSAPFNVIVTIIIVVSLLINNYLSISFPVESKEGYGMRSTGSRNKEEQEKEKHGEEGRSVSVSFSRSRALARSLARSFTVSGR